jgi:hypothetical protein
MDELAVVSVPLIVHAPVACMVKPIPLFTLQVSPPGTLKVV